MIPDDPVLSALSALPPPGPDPARAAGVRRRCHAVLKRRSGVRPIATLAGDLLRRFLEPALVAGLCAVYLAEVIRRAAALFGL